MPYICDLIHDCNVANEAIPIDGYPRVFEDCQPEDVDGVRNAIYIIREVDGDNEYTFRQLRDYKRSEDARSCPRLNAPNDVMYVGSSVGRLRRRIMQHVGSRNLGEKYKSTSALNLERWFEGHYQIEVKPYPEEITPQVLQIIEDACADDLQPAFGKRGGNGR